MNTGRVATVAAVSGGIVALSIVIGTLAGELPEPAWVLLVPIGMFGAGLVCLVSLALLVAGRLRGS